MKTFQDLTEDGLEHIRTRIENTLRDHHQLFLGFFPEVEFKENANEDELVFRIRTGKLHLGEPSHIWPADLDVIIRSNFMIEVHGYAIAGPESATITNLIKSTIGDYLSKEGFIG